jgi:hypothetical protein
MSRAGLALLFPFALALSCSWTKPSPHFLSRSFLGKKNFMLLLALLDFSRSYFCAPRITDPAFPMSLPLPCPYPFPVPSLPLPHLSRSPPPPISSICLLLSFPSVSFPVSFPRTCHLCLFHSVSSPLSVPFSLILSVSRLSLSLCLFLSVSSSLSLPFPPSPPVHLLLSVSDYETMNEKLYLYNMHLSQDPCF